MKHLLFISTVFPTPWEPHKGPANTNLVAMLRRLDCRVTVIAPVPWTARLRSRHSAEVTGEHYPVYWYVPGMMRERYHSMLGWSLRKSLRRITSSDSTLDAVLGCWTDPDGSVAVEYARMRGIPSGVIAVGSDIMLLPTDPERRARVARTLRSADHVFGIGSEIVRRAIGFGADPARVSNFIRGADLQRFRPGNRLEARRKLGIPGTGPLLLWVGNMVRVKAPDRVIQAARGLLASFPDLQVAMIGQGPLEPALKALAAQSSEVSSRIIFAGPVASDALPAWYQASNVLVLPSRSEGIPNVLVEGMATGLPFVASRVGSVEDLLPFGPSQTVPEGDLVAFERAIGDVLQQESAIQLTPKRFDLVDGAREILHHLHLEQP